MRAVRDGDCCNCPEIGAESKRLLRIPGGAPVRRVALGGITAFAVYLASVGLTYCSQLLIARIVGIDTYGIYAYVFAWMAVLGYFSTLGFDVALLRFVPAYEAEKEWSLVSGVIQYSQRSAAVVGVLVVLVGISITLLRTQSLSAELAMERGEAP